MAKKTSGSAAGGGEHASVTPNDYPRLFDGARWQPAGNTPAQQLASIDALARTMYPPAQPDSMRDDGALANLDFPAGYTYFGQFVVHDLSHHRIDRATVGGVGATTGLVNLRQKKLALELLFGSGPSRSHELFEAADPTRLRVEERESVDGVVFHDLARDSTGRAIVEDWRQDENVMVSQMHVAFARAYNALAAAVRTRLPHASSFEVHDRARTALVHAYQWLILNDLVPRMVDAPRKAWLKTALANVAAGARPAYTLFGERAPFLSAETAFAAMRCGHALVREQYRPRRNGYLFPLTPSTKEPGWLATPGPHLTLFRPLPATFAVEWNAFLPNAEGIDWERARRFGPKLAWSLSNLPRTKEQPETTARLSYLTLFSGWADPVRLVPGAVAAQKLGLQAAAGVEEPMWRYLLIEAEKETQGRTLGALGSTLVAETLLGLLTNRTDTYFTRGAEWTPPFGDDESSFVLLDLLRLGDRPVEWVAGRID